MPNITRHSHNDVDYHGKNDMVSSLGVEREGAENAAGCSNGDESGYNHGNYVGVASDNVEQGRLFDITQHSHDAIDDYDMDNMTNLDVECITVKSSVEAGMSSGHGSSKRDSLDAGKSGGVNCISGVDLRADIRKVNDAESDMLMRLNLNDILDDTVGKLELNNR